MKRSAERLEFLNDVLITFAEGGIQMIGEVLDKEMFGDFKDVREPSGYNWISVRYSDEEEPESHKITIDTVAQGFSRLSKGEVDYLSELGRKRLLKCSRENDAGEIDAVDATGIIEIALFGKVTYA